MTKTMRLSLIGNRFHCIVHCVDENGNHESGYNLFIMESGKSYGLRPITGVSEEGGFVLRDSDRSPKLNREASNV